ncbi:MAG: winged helix-turn-helix domain-containing protein [Candidatus Bathyarchaeota archaeon]|nr:winged helix-turn-helix domain-containing protein [Candidatus Bathyarchaeota archaeon]
MELEEVFSSKPRIKILKILYTLSSLNVSDIAKRIKMNYASTAEHLELLEAEGILEERKYGRIRMYRFKEGSERAQAVAGLIQAWEEK